MRRKYIEEKISPFYVFGEYPDGFVDIATSEDSTFVAHISRENAKKLIEDREKVIDLVEKIYEVRDIINGSS